MTADEPTGDSRHEPDAQNIRDETVHSRPFGSENAQAATQETPYQLPEAEVDVEAWHYSDEPEASVVQLGVDLGDRTVWITYGADEAQALGEKIAAAGRFAAGDHLDDEGDQ